MRDDIDVLTRRHKAMAVDDKGRAGLEAARDLHAISPDDADLNVTPLSQ